MKKNLTRLEVQRTAHERIAKLIKERHIKRGDRIKVLLDENDPRKNSVEIGEFIEHVGPPSEHSNSGIKMIESRHGNECFVPDPAILGVYQFMFGIKNKGGTENAR